MLEHENDKQELDEEEAESRPGRDLYEWMQALVCSVLVVVLLFTFVVRLIGVDGHSMVPTLQDGDRLLVLNSILYDDYQYGDIVVLRKESFLAEPIVKRVIATGGQTVDIDFETGSVYVDGELLKEDYINELTFLEEGTEFPLTGAGGQHLRHGRQPQQFQRQPGLPAGDGGYPLCHRQGGVPGFPGNDESTGERDFGRIGVIA